MIRDSWRRVSNYLHRPRRTLAVVATSSLFGAVSEALALVLVVSVAMLAAGQTTSAPEIPLLGLALEPAFALALAAGLALTNIGAHVVNARAIGTIHAEVMETARRRTLEGYFKATWSKQAVQREGELIETTGVLSERLSLAAVSLAAGISNAVQMVALLTAATLVDPTATLIVIIAGTAVFAILRPLTGAIRRRSQRSVSTNTELLDELGNVATTALELRAFGVEDLMLESLEVKNQQVARSRRATQTAIRISQTLYRDLAILLLVGAVAAIYVIEPAELAPLAAVFLLVLRAANSAQAVQSLRGHAAEYAPTLDLVESRIADLDRHRRRHGSAPLERIEHLVVDGVSYQYARDRPALEHVDLMIEPCEIIGVIGPSGGGKSTLVQILLRLRPPTRGDVLVNGMPYEEIADVDWQRLVSVVPQETHLIEGTIAENIVFMRPGITRSQVIDAARRAHILDEVEALPDGLDTRLGTRGVGLSGGQQQRLMIARALVGEPQMLVLDEPTSALDEDAERSLRTTLSELGNELAIVLITHRPVPLSVCDRVITIENGRVTNVERPERASHPAEP